MHEDRAVHERVGKNIQRLRELHDLTQEELTEGSSVSLSYLREIEAGIANPTLTTLSRIAKGLSVDISELMALTPSEAKVASARERAIDRILSHLDEAAAGVKRLKA